jgi:hypothetical protein
MPVRFSTRAPNADYLGFEASHGAIVTAAKKAEEVGFDAILVNDHIIVGNDARSATALTSPRPRAGGRRRRLCNKKDGAVDQASSASALAISRR